MASHTLDIEKGLVSASAASAIPSVSSSSSPASSSPDKAISNPSSSRHTPLQLFQLLVGIKTPPSLTSDGIDHGRSAGSKKRRFRSENVGLYERAKQQERTSRIAYQATSFISNTLFLMQILLAASFTAMSAYKDSNRVALTILGAANTVLAGCLAWQKGQGVPQRYRKAQDAYQALLLEIEMAERSFLDVENNTSDPNAFKLDPHAEKERLQHMFDVARADQQANYPDLYVSTGGPAPKESKDAAKDAAKELEDTKAEAMKVQGELMAKIEALMSKLASKVDAHVEAAVSSVAKEVGGSTVAAKETASSSVTKA